MKQRIKKVLILLLVIMVIFATYFIFKACTVEKQRINVKYTSSVSTESNLEAIISVTDDNDNTKKSKVVLELFDNDNKKIKGTKETFKLDEGEVKTCSLPIPEDLEPGSYILKLKAISGLLSSKKEVSVNVSGSNNSDLIISLDKGIYKPGDTIKYQALFISKNDTNPKDSKDLLVEILDGNNNRVYSQDSTTSEFGIISGEFELASEVNSGTYTISVSSNSKKVSKTFTVNPYVVPQFEVAITSDKDIYQVGETANITFNAKYFFGEPVSNASVVATIEKEEITGFTDANGDLVYTYELKDKGKKDIKVSITDTSNYLIEATKTIYAQENAFEVETIFENDIINKNIDNTVYVFAKKIDGTPVKVHATINVDNITRQVITDETGIGKFTLTAQDTALLNSEATYKITAQDEENNTYSNIATIAVNTSSVAISTDKVKYNQGEDIKIDLNSITDSSTRSIYICKNNEIIKMISTDKDSITLNLEDVSGLIDIFVERQVGRYSDSYYDDYNFDVIPITTNSTFNYSYKNFARKTIFIKPTKALDIAVYTDKEEYKPGENLNISFEIKDNENNKPDTNLLVSILDEAVLSLANNNLSMDNIRLALKDIELTDEISASDLYADVLDEKSESRLILSLVKHDAADPSIIENNSLDTRSYDYYTIIILLVLGIILILMIYDNLTKSKKFTKVIEDVLIVLSIILIVIALFGYDIYYTFTDNSLLKTIISVSVIVLIVYCLILYKFREKLFLLLRNLVVIPGIYAVILSAIYANSYNSDVVWIGILAVPVVMTILVVWSRKHKLNKALSFLKELTILLTKSGIAYFISLIITDMTFDNGACFVIILILVYMLLDKIYRAKILNEEPSTKPIDVGEVVVVLIFIAIIIALVGLSSIVSQFSSTVYEPPYNDSTLDLDSSLVGPSVKFDQSIQEGSMATNDSSSGFDFIGDMFSLGSKSATNEATYGEDAIFEEIDNSLEVVEENSEEVSDEVRNVFLESLAFIPDLVVKGGNGSTSLKLSDNITTWNIQVVGNTQDGNIGSATKTFKVFKEFFVDFTLPTNSIVTDKTSIPVTVYNYTDNPLNVSLNAVQNDWSTMGIYEQNITVDAKNTKLVYIPIEITKSGNNVFRVEASANGVSDIVEKTFTVTPNGYKKENVISSATIEKSFETDYFAQEKAIENTRNLKLKIYPSAISQAIEGMENIFSMPTGCFEQTSSSLYPNILALKYLEDNNLDEEEIRQKALDYISKGYQRLLTFEVNGTKGGYSLYGSSPAEPVITAFGLMELSDAWEVYDIDEEVIDNMIEYLYSVQKINGSFDIGSTYIGGASSESDLAMNSYIIWALSEVDPEDIRLETSIEYLEGKVDEAEDNYTLALMANIFTNVKNKNANSVINKLLENVQETDDSAYITSGIRDYYGCYGNYQAIQTTALTSMVLSKNNLHSSTNNSLIKYIISRKDSRGTWGNTQSTVLALKAINSASRKSKISGQTISVSVNNETKDINIGNNPLDIYEVEFENVPDENKIEITMKKGSITYELVEEYYVPYESITANDSKYNIEISEVMNTNLKVNDTVSQQITLTNNSDETIANGLINITIPQGFTVDEAFLEKCKTLGYIEKYEYNYTSLNLYIRNFEPGAQKNIEVQYRANYPEEIVGGTIRAFDYYNPNIEGVEAPVKIIVSE